MRPCLFKFLLIALLAPLAVTGQWKLDHLAFSVRSLDNSVTFYKNILGMEEIENRAGREGIRWLSIDGEKELHLISTVPGKIQVNKAVHFAVATSEFDSFLESLVENGIPYSDWDGMPGNTTLRADGVRQVYIQDPDGYWIEVNEQQ